MGTDIVQQLAIGMRDAQSTVAELAQRLDVSNLGHAKWELLKCADKMQAVLQRTGLDGGSATAASWHAKTKLQIKV